MVDFTTTTGDLELHDWHGSKLLAQPVLDALTRFTSEGIIDPAQILGVSENLDEESDTDIFCPRYGLDLAQAGNVVIVHTHKTRKAPRNSLRHWSTAIREPILTVWSSTRCRSARSHSPLWSTPQPPLVWSPEACRRLVCRQNGQCWSTRASWKRLHCSLEAAYAPRNWSSTAHCSHTCRVCVSSKGLASLADKRGSSSAGMLPHVSGGIR